jgi:hypothetical protein
MFGSLDYEGQPVAYPDLRAVMMTACITILSLLLQILKLQVC